MFDDKDRKYFYNEFKNNGYEVGSYDDFKKDLNNKEDRDWYYSEAKNMGYDVGSQEDFDKMVLEPSSFSSSNPVATAPVSTAPTTATQQAQIKVTQQPVLNENPEQQEQRVPVTNQPVDAITGANNEEDVDAIFGKYVGKGDAVSETIADLMANGMANSQEEAQPLAMAAMNRAAQRLAKHTADSFVSQLGDTVENIDQSIYNGWYSHDVQDSLKKNAAQLGIQNLYFGNEQDGVKESKEYDNFINSFVKPAMVESLVKKYGQNYRKQAEDIATRLYTNDDSVQGELMNRDINSAIEGVISKYLQPSVVEEYNKAQEAGKEAFGKGMEGSQYIPGNLRIGNAIASQYEANQASDAQKTLAALNKKFASLYRNGEFLSDIANATYNVMQKYGAQGGLSGKPEQYKPMIQGVLKNELTQLEVKGLMPKGSAEYIMKSGLENTILGKIERKVMHSDYQNWLEDMANQQYQPGFWENVASGALTFAGDAWSYWLPGAAGGKITKAMLSKAESALATDLFAKGMGQKAAERAAKLIIGRSKGVALKQGMAHGATTFGGQALVSTPVNEIYKEGQPDEEGKTYETSIGKILYNTLGDVAKGAALGAVMQGGTLANIVGKGKGLAVNILADAGGKVMDSGIMAGQSIIEHMAADPSFKPTGKDAARSFLESMANLTAIGLPGMMGKYARFKSAQEFNRKYDFTNEDLADLNRLGYNSLYDTFKEMGINDTRMLEGDGELMGQLSQKYMNFMNDKSVPETLKAKVMAAVEGKRPNSFSPVMDSQIIQPVDGNPILETYNEEGGVIERKQYSSLEAAEKANKNLEYDKSLNLTAAYESAYHSDAMQDKLNTQYQLAVNKYNVGDKLSDSDKTAVYLYQNANAIKEIISKQQSGMELTEQEQKLLSSYQHTYDEAFENSPIMKEYIRTFEDSMGVSHGTLRKALEGDGKSRTEEQQKLVEAYQKQLYGDIMLRRDANSKYTSSSSESEQQQLESSPSATASEKTVEENAAEHIIGSKEEMVSATDGGTPPPPPTAPVVVNPVLSENKTSESSPVAPEEKVSSPTKRSDAFVMGQNAYINADADGLKAISRNDDLSVARLMRLYGGNENAVKAIQKAYSEGKDMEEYINQRDKYLSSAQKDAIRKYAEAQDAKNGVYDALQHADDGLVESLEEQLATYTNEKGEIVPATLTDGSRVFIKKQHDGGGAFAVIPGVNGQATVKQIADTEIADMDTLVPLNDYIAQMVAAKRNSRTESFIGDYTNEVMRPGDEVDLLVDGGKEPTTAQFVRTEPTGDVTISINGNEMTISMNDFDAWATNANNLSINNELDAEDAQRAADEAAQAEIEKKQRFTDNIVGYSDGQVDYSSKESDPKVVAEYLQDEYGEDHNKLIGLINGSRQDIKEQLDNKKKAAAEYENWLDTNSDLDPERAQKISDELKLVNVQMQDLQARYNNWTTIRNSVMTEDETRAMREERRKEIEKAGIDASAITPSEEREVPVLDNNELKKQYPSMDEASAYITSQRRVIYKIQSEDVQKELDGVNRILEQYTNGEIDLEPEQLMELNTTKAQLEARHKNLNASAKELKAQADKLKSLYRKENIAERKAVMENLSPAEQRAAKVDDAVRSNNLSALNTIYEGTGVDFTDDTPNTIKEYVAQSIGRNTLNYEGKEVGGAFSNGLKQELGLSRSDLKSLQVLAKEGEGKTSAEFVHELFDGMPDHLREQGYTDQDIRDALLDILGSAETYSDIKRYSLNNKIAEAESRMATIDAQEEEQRLAYEQEKKVDKQGNLVDDKGLEKIKRQAEREDGQLLILPSKTEEVGALSDPTVSLSSGGKVTNNSDNNQENSQVFSERLKNAIAETDSDSTEAQKKAGNYKKGHISFGGYDFTVETPKGATRSGKDENGKPWSVTMHDTYGYIRGKIGVDGDHIDMFINDDADLDTFDGNVVVIDQVNPETGEFDEHKVMYGYPDEPTAVSAYLKNYSPGWKGLGKVTSVPKETFDKWLESSDRKTKPFRDYAMIQKETSGSNQPFGATLSMDDLPFMRTVKAVQPKDMTEAQQVAYKAVSTMLKKAGVPVKVVSNEDMEKVAAEYDDMVLNMLLHDPKLRFNIKTSEEREAAERAYNWGKEHRPDKWHQYVLVNMEKPNQMPEYFQKKSLADTERRFYNKDVYNDWGQLIRAHWGNYKLFDLNRPFEEQIKDVKGSVPTDYDPYKEDNASDTKDAVPSVETKEEDSYAKLFSLLDKKRDLETEYEELMAKLERYTEAQLDNYRQKMNLASDAEVSGSAFHAAREEARSLYKAKIDANMTEQINLQKELDALAPGDRVSFMRTYHGSGAEEGDMNYVIFKPEDMKIQDHTKFAKNKGTVYGYTDGNQIVLNQDHLNPNTPIHEYQHIWRTAAKELNPDLIKHGDDLIRKTSLYERVKSNPNYSHLSDEEICDEAFARLVGQDGEKILEDMANDAIKKNPFDTAKELSVINALKQWLKKFWYWALDTFTKWKPEDIKKMSLQDIRNLVFRDLANGVDPRKSKNSEVANDKKIAPEQQLSATDRVSDSSVTAKKNVEKVKEMQLKIINETNPMLDDYHTGIRKVEDIKTFDEAMTEAQSNKDKYGYSQFASYPDTTDDLLLDALKTGKITVYSSKPIVNGNFVTPSRIQAEEYAGGGKVYEKTVSVNDIAWIDVDEGQFAKVPSKKRFMFAGEKGAVELDKSKQVTDLLDSLVMAKKMAEVKKDAKTIKLATGWEVGKDGKWRYEMPDFKFKESIDLSNPFSHHTLYSLMEHDSYDRYKKMYIGRYGYVPDVYIQRVYSLTNADEEKNKNHVMAYVSSEHGTRPSLTLVLGKNYFNNKVANLSSKKVQSVLNHELQHLIQMEEGFATGGSPMMGEKYHRLAGEVEARNVESRLGMSPEERRNSLASETEDVDRVDQIVTDGEGASYSVVTNPDLIKELDNEETIKVYRAMQVGEDGKLYPPMAAKVKGKMVQPIELGKWEQADERPELADDKGRFTLNKGNGKSLKAAYNPYLHTSRTPLNDQFSEAQNRPNIVTVEVEVPKSELTSGYKADKAKDAVGEVEWKAGIVQGQLTGKRKVVLSRYDKPIRIVPDSEVADVIVNDMFKGKDITMPSNVVTPSLRKELEARGVPFVETDTRGRIVGGENNGVHYSKIYGNKSNVKLSLGDGKETRIQKLRNSKPIEITGEEITPSDDLKQYKKNALEYGKTLRGKYVNEDTGEEIDLTGGNKRGGIREILQHDYKDIEHLQSIAAIPKIIEKSIFIEELPNEDSHRYPDVKTFRYYVCGLKIGGKDYTVKAVVAEQNNGRRYYDHRLTNIEKGKLLSIIPTIQKAGIESNLPNFEYKDKRLISILQTNSEKNAENVEKIVGEVQNAATQLGGAQANVYTDVDDVPKRYRPAVEKGARGWYDPKDHTIHVYLPNCTDIAEAQRTVFHEKIGHEGLEVLLGGEDEVRKFADFVYKNVDKNVRGKILDFANKYDPDWKNEDRMNVGTQEYVAHLAEEGPKTDADFSLWTKIKHYLVSLLKKMGINIPGLLNDKDLRYYLMRAGKALHVWDSMPKEKQDAIKQQASFEEVKESLGEDEADDKKKRLSERKRIEQEYGPIRLAPNGVQSSLSKKQYIEARTAKFKDWFGGDWEKTPKKFTGKLDINGEPLEKYIEGFIHRPKKPTFPRRRKDEDEATFFQRQMLHSKALEDFPETEKAYKQMINELDELDFSKIKTPQEDDIRKKYMEQYETDLAEFKMNAGIPADAERPAEPKPSDYDSLLDLSNAWAQYHAWDYAPEIKDYERMADDEITSRLAVLNAVKHPYSEADREKAMNAEFYHMRHVLSSQRIYDKNTANAVVQFARRFMALGYGDNLGRGAINKLLRIVRNSVGTKPEYMNEQIYQVMNLLMDNQLRNLDNAVTKTMSIKELKENAKGIQVQGKLELRGQATIKAFRDAIGQRLSSAALDERISGLIDKMADDKENASSYQDELLGLQFAKQYIDNIDGSRADATEIENLKREEVDSYNKGTGRYADKTQRNYAEHMDTLRSYDEELFTNKLERMKSYAVLLDNLGGMITDSVKGAREFVEREAKRAVDIKMLASADLREKSLDQFRKENWKTRLANGNLVRFLFAPTGSFDAMLREIGSKNADGEGHLWNHFIRGCMDASDGEYLGVKQAENELDLKVSELFGKVSEDKDGNKKGNMIMSDLYKLQRSSKEMKTLDVAIHDVEGNKTYTLQQGNLMYIYMVNKMTDGAMKLRQMGITEGDVDRIKDAIDPRMLKLADWIQGEFLPKLRTKYNKRHEELFGAPMPIVENYFPLRVLKSARYQEEDVNNTSDGSNILPSVATGAIIKRRINKLPLDILNADALSVTLENVREMENWYNYAPIRKDANILLSDTGFRNRMQNLTTIYGSGERLWNNFKDATSVAMGTYRPKGNTDTAIAIKNIAKGITGAKITFRLYTAFKQTLSAPLFLPDVNIGRFLWYSINPKGSFEWAIKNMPDFEKRWLSRKIGDTVLMNDPTDWKLWRNELVKKAAYYGMTPNAFVDAVTVAVGARAVYDAKYKSYIDYGLDEAKAKEKALQDAAINFNTSQQSSENAFVSPMQLDRTLESSILTPFRNSSMLYERKGLNALRNLKHRFEKGYKEASIKYMAGQLMDDGVEYEQANKAAERMYNKGLWHNIASAMVALWLGPIFWNFGTSLGYLLFGDDNNKKKKMIADSAILGLLEGPIDGLNGGQFFNSAVANTITSDGIQLKGLKDLDLSGLPMLSDMNTMMQKFGYDKVAAAQDLMFLVMQSSTGFNPKTLTDAVNACIDYSNGDMTNAKEIALFIFRLTNGPAVTTDNLYIDELGMTGKQTKKLSYEELAKRYGEYKFGKNTFGLGSLYTDEEKQNKLSAIEKSFDEKVSERLAELDREDLTKEFDEYRSQREKKLIGKIIADEMETKDSEAAKVAKGNSYYLQQRSFADLTDDLFLQRQLESTSTAEKGLQDLKDNGAPDSEISAYKQKHKAELNKHKDIQNARRQMQKVKAKIASPNDETSMHEIRSIRDKIIRKLRLGK